MNKKTFTRVLIGLSVITAVATLITYFVMKPEKPWLAFYVACCGGVFLSSVVLALLKRYTKLPLVSVSIIAAICHNIGQMFVISFVISSAALMPYIFVMLAASIPTGILTGLTAIEVLKRVKREQFQ